jgi:hypothetical protein
MKLRTTHPFTRLGLAACAGAGIVVSASAADIDVVADQLAVNPVYGLATLDGDRLELDFTPTTQGQYFYKVSGPKDMVYELTLID